MSEALDGLAQVGLGAGNHPRQDDSGAVQPPVRPDAGGDRALGRGRQTRHGLRAKPEDVREPYERQLKDLQEAYDEAKLHN